MTPPSTQNLKVLDLWVFFLICCSIFSFLLSVRLRLTLGYLTVSPSSESLSSTLVHSSSSGSIFKHEYLTYKWPSLIPPFTHLNGTHLPGTFIKRIFDRYMDQTVLIWAGYSDELDSDTTCCENPRGKHWGDLTRMRTRAQHTREWHHLQPKTLRHWICGSSFLYVAQHSHFYSMWDLDSHLNT